MRQLASDAGRPVQLVYWLDAPTTRAERFFQTAASVAWSFLSFLFTVMSHHRPAGQGRWFLHQEPHPVHAIHVSRKRLAQQVRPRSRGELGHDLIILKDLEFYRRGAFAALPSLSARHVAKLARFGGFSHIRLVSSTRTTQFASKSQKKTRRRETLEKPSLTRQEFEQGWEVLREAGQISANGTLPQTAHRFSDRLCSPELWLSANLFIGSLSRRELHHQIGGRKTPTDT